VIGPEWLAAAQRQVESALGGRLTPVVIGLAVLLAVLLGAGHAALPGHGKTVMAAYFAGRRGRVRDALAVGGTVTLAHTGGVLLVGLLLSTSTALAGERVLAWLGVASGVLVAAVGVGMLVAALRSRRAGAAGHSHGPHGHHHHHTGHDHHHHDHDQVRRPGGRLGLAGIGLAGGLVPSPSALVVLLGAIGLGRAGLGVLLVLAYGIGMAGTLTAVGLLLVVAQRRLGRLIARGGAAARVGGLFARLGGRVSASAPAATAALVVLVGLGMGVRAVA
jgi:ABC-type nickel/cobalt efflux system permease component RcnA